MKNHKWTRIAVGGVAVLVLALSATLAFAQTNGGTPEATTPEAPATAPEVQEDSTVDSAVTGKFDRRGGHAGHKGTMNNEFLAGALGISVEELETAMSTAREAALADREAGVALDRSAGETYLADALGISAEELTVAKQAAKEAALEQAVADGVITAEQAELMQAREALKGYIDREVLLANVLGISAEELAATHADGIRSTDLLEELGMTVTEAQAALQAAHDAAIAQAVADGVITQAQADQLSANAGLGSRGGFELGGRGGRGHGGSGHDCDGLDSQQVEPQVPAGVSQDA